MTRPPPPAPNASRLAAWLIAASLAVLALRIAMRFDASSLLDDAYMFLRYADSLRTTGVVSFHAGGPPAYGLTSLGFLLAVLPLRMASPDNPVIPMLAASTMCGIAFLILAGVLVAAATGGEPRRRRLALAGLAVALAPATESLALHFTSGMDTTLVMAYLALFLLAAYRLETSPGRGPAIGVGLLGGLAWSVRPDLMLFTVGAPLAMLALGSGARERRLSGLVLGIVLVVAGVQASGYALALGSPVPLPFFAKATPYYGPEVAETYRRLPLLQLARYLGFHALLFGGLAWLVVRDPRGWWARSSPLEKGLAGATALFLAYYAFFVLQIMYHGQRFYYPTLPAVAFLAARAAGRLPRPEPSMGRGWVAVVALAALVALGRPAWRLVSSPGVRLPAEARFDVFAEYRIHWERYWFALDEFARLPDDLVIATTEVGHPLAMSPGRRIVDLSGLNETSLALGRESVDELVRRVRPDLVYLPHPDYVSLNRRLAADPSFARDYEVWPAARLDADMDLAVRRDGRYAPALRAIVESRLDRTRGAGR